MDDVTPPGVPFDADTWRQLPDFLDQLPEPVCLHLWGDAAGEPASPSFERSQPQRSRISSEKSANARVVIGLGPPSSAKVAQVV